MNELIEKQKKQLEKSYTKEFVNNHNGTWRHLRGLYLEDTFEHIHNWHINSIKEILEVEVKRHEEQIIIHKKIIAEHTVAPFKWHEGRIDGAKVNIEYLTNIISNLK